MELTVEKLVKECGFTVVNSSQQCYRDFPDLKMWEDKYLYFSKSNKLTLILNDEDGEVSGEMSLELPHIKTVEQLKVLWKALTNTEL